MQTQQSKASITFRVHEVEQATEPKKTVKTNDSVALLAGGVVEACCDYTDNCVEAVSLHPLIAATHLAFSEHRPLVLSPDMIWTTIVQGLAQHVRNYPEQLRGRFVSHQGKLLIQVERDDIHKGSPENPWDDVIHQFSRGIKEHLGDAYNRLISDFSTTGQRERTACEVALLDTFQPYFEYVMYCVCGITEITLEGPTADWQRLREKVEVLNDYGLQWWTRSLVPLADQFVRASGGDIDLQHWRDIYKRHKQYGVENVNGWMINLIPYLKNFRSGNYTVRNPLFDDPNATVSTSALPSGVSEVPFVARYRTGDTPMTFLGGFLGVTQNEESLALRPKLGWAVRQQSENHKLLARFKSHSPAPPLAQLDFDNWQGKFHSRCEWPGDFLLFYKSCNGVTLFRDSVDGSVRFLPLENVEPVGGIRPTCPATWPNSILTWDSDLYVRFCDLSDGSFVAMELTTTSLAYTDGWEQGWKIVRKHGEDEEASVIAWSFGEFLKRALECGGVLDALTAPVRFKEFKSFRGKSKK